MSFNQLKKESKEREEPLESSTYKVAILGGHATQFLRKALEMTARLEGFRLDVYEAEYKQIEREIIDENSALYSFAPDSVIITYSARAIRNRFYKMPTNSRPNYYKELSDELAGHIGLLSSRITAKVLLFNLEEINDAVFGNYSSKTRYSFLNQIRRYNVEVMDITEGMEHVFMIDINSLFSLHGSSYSHLSSMYVTADLIYSLDMCAAISEQVIKVIQNFRGKFKKCIILDLDNITWGGIIGDDGLSGIQIGNLGIGKAFSEFQMWVKELKERGIILAVCSKNQEEIAKEPFEKHPDMVLSLSDISVFVANWENKADNIRYIQEIVNVGFDSMVFFDDNPAEREIVKANIPEITVPDLPEDPAEYLSYTASLNLFETISFSTNDANRTQQYQEESKRKKLSHAYTDMTEFLSSLEMVSDIGEFDDFDVPRIAQLSQRSNQFNLRTIRYTEDEIKSIKNGNNHVTYSVKLKDKFGEYGLICVVLLNKKGDKELFIDTWIMSCRVLKRDVEKFVLNKIVEDGLKGGFDTLIGEYVPTEKNVLVKDHYKELGFNKNDDNWSLKLKDYNPYVVYINEE